LTVIDNAALALAPPPEPVTVYVVAADTAVGVPVSVPSGARLNPGGSVGLTLKDERGPVTVGLSGAMALPTVNTRVVDG
jgi:hypothetical protein